MPHRNRSRRIGVIGWFTIGLVTLVVAALAVFWCFLADYQASLPKNLATEILTAYQKGDVRPIKAYSTNLPEPLEDPELFKECYAPYADGLYFYAGAAENPEELCYEYVSDNRLIATLTLSETGEKSPFGFKTYEIHSITGHPLTSYRITAPSDAMLFVNGRLLGERYRVEDVAQVEGFTGLIATPFRTKAYEVTDFAYIDELDAVSVDGGDYSIFWSEDGSTASIGRRITEEEQAEIEAFAIEFSEVYSVFATKRNGPRTPVSRLVYPGSPFLQALQLYGNEWGEIYPSDRFENRTVDAFTRYSATEFSCNIRFDYIIRMSDGFEKTYPNAMTYYLTKRDGQLRLVDMQPL